MSEPAPEGKWYHSVPAILLSLFIVLGPFGLPLLWKSPRFTRPWKWVFTALTLLYTGLILQFTLSSVMELARVRLP